MIWFFKLWSMSSIYNGSNNNLFFVFDTGMFKYWYFILMEIRRTPYCSARWFNGLSAWFSLQLRFSFVYLPLMLDVYVLAILDLYACCASKPNSWSQSVIFARTSVSFRPLGMSIQILKSNFWTNCIHITCWLHKCLAFQCFHSWF